eukprot:6861875-Lingulodinium_polyedra.AAC.1
MLHAPAHEELRVAVVGVAGVGRVGLFKELGSASEDFHAAQRQHVELALAASKLQHLAQNEMLVDAAIAGWHSNIRHPGPIPRDRIQPCRDHTAEVPRARVFTLERPVTEFV